MTLRIAQNLNIHIKSGNFISYIWKNLFDMTENVYALMSCFFLFVFVLLFLYEYTYRKSGMEFFF